MKRYLACECGYFVVAEGTDDLVAHARSHARRTHGIDLTDEQVLWLSRPLGEEPTGAEERQ